MANITLDKLPGTLKRHAARICDYENDTYNDNGHWVHLSNGWRNSDDPLGANHTIHELTLSECAHAVRSANPCDCRECVAGLADLQNGNQPLKK